MPRPDHISQEVWLAAKGVSVRFASDAEITRMAEMIMRRQAGEDEPRDGHRIQWQPFLSYRQTDIIRRALLDYETVFDDDVSELYKLRSWFSSME